MPSSRGARRAYLQTGELDIVDIDVGMDGLLMRCRDDVRPLVENFHGARHKAFLTHDAAKEWLCELNRKEVEEENRRIEQLYPGSGDTEEEEDKDEDEDDAGPESPAQCTIQSGPQVIYPNLDRLTQNDSSSSGSSSSFSSSSSSESPRSPQLQSLYRVPIDLPELSPEQDRVLSLVKEGHNVFFTGPAGSGKSLILKHIQRHLHSVGKEYAVTATTGISAVLIDGQTIYSWGRLGKGEKSVHYYIKRMENNLKQSNKSGQKQEPSWKYTQVLIIDEISMVSFPYY
jgi:PIF1-like helicase